MLFSELQTMFFLSLQVSKKQLYRWENLSGSLKMDLWPIMQTNIIKKSQLIFSQFISQNNSEISFLFSGLDSRNGTYASLAFISGVERKNPSTRCGITSFLKSVKKA